MDASHLDGCFALADVHQSTLNTTGPRDAKWQRCHGRALAKKKKNSISFIAKSINMQQAVVQSGGLVQGPAVFNTPYYRPVAQMRPARPPHQYLNGSTGPRSGYNNAASNGSGVAAGQPYQGGKGPRAMPAMAPTYRAHQGWHAATPPHQSYTPNVRFTTPQYTQHYVSHNTYGYRTAASPANTNSSSSSNTGSQSGTLSTSLSNNVSNTTANSTSSGCANEQLSKTNLYIRGLLQNTTDKDLVALCNQYGTIISTKAILDKTTNKCKGYGFVDFENVSSAEVAVRALQSKGIQAQMAKVGIPVHRHTFTQQEQDPTNLYLANLPMHFKENDVDSLLAQYGQVISTRILRDTVGQSKGVGFARMETKEKCEQIIEIFNGRQLPGAKEPLLVKFADGGSKKRTIYKSDTRWRDPSDPNGGSVGYETPISQNGVSGGHLVPTISQYNRGYPQHVGSYSLPAGWLPQYAVMPPMTTVDDQYTCQLAGPAMHGYKSEGPQPRGIPVMMSGDPGSVQYGAMMQGQLTAHMNALQIGTPTQYITQHPYLYAPAPPAIITVPIAEPGSATASPDDNYQQ